MISKLRRYCTKCGNVDSNQKNIFLYQLPQILQYKSCNYSEIQIVQRFADHKELCSVAKQRIIM